MIDELPEPPDAYTSSAPSQVRRISGAVPNNVTEKYDRSPTPIDNTDSPYWKRPILLANLQDVEP